MSMFLRMQVSACVLSMGTAEPAWFQTQFTIMRYTLVCATQITFYGANAKVSWLTVRLHMQGSGTKTGQVRPPVYLSPNNAAIDTRQIEPNNAAIA